MNVMFEMFLLSNIYYPKQMCMSVLGWSLQ